MAWLGCLEEITWLSWGRWSRCAVLGFLEEVLKRGLLGRWLTLSLGLGLKNVGFVLCLSFQGIGDGWIGSCCFGSHVAVFPGSLELCCDVLILFLSIVLLFVLGQAGDDRVLAFLVVGFVFGTHHAHHIPGAQLAAFRGVLRLALLAAEHPRRSGRVVFAGRLAALFGHIASGISSIGFFGRREFLFSGVGPTIRFVFVLSGNGFELISRAIEAALKEGREGFLSCICRFVLRSAA